MNYKPLGNRIVVKILHKDEVEVGSLKLKVAFKPNQKEWDADTVRAQVLRLGPDVMDISENDIVVIAGSAGRWMDFDIHGTTDTHRIIDADEVLAIDESDPVASKEAVHVN